MPAAPHACSAIRKDGTPCPAFANGSGLCISHDPARIGLAEASRARGGRGRSNRRRIIVAFEGSSPRPLIDRVTDALDQVTRGELDPRAGAAASTLAATLLKAIESANIEARVKAIEDRIGGKTVAWTPAPSRVAWIALTRCSMNGSWGSSRAFRS